MLSQINIFLYNISMLIRGNIGCEIASDGKPYRGQARLPIFKQGGQVLLEYAVILAIVVSAMLGMKLYVQRMLQGRYRAASDRAIRTIIVAQESDSALPLQYDPYYEESDTITSTDLEITEEYYPGGSSAIIIDRDERSTTGMRWELPYSR